MSWRRTTELSPAGVTPLADYRARIDALCSERPHMKPLRGYNRQMVETLAKQRPMAGRRVLDLGAAYAGFALERALELGVSEYVGVSLEVGETHEVAGPTGSGRLLHMNAEQLELPDQSFDLGLSLSSFEHFRDGARVLEELRRVLVPGGAALVSFEPIWTSSYGHHLHHLPRAASVVPPWAHLIWSAEDMRRRLEGRWPADAELTLEQALEWVYTGDQINRVPIDVQRRAFEQGPLAIEWMVPLRDQRAEELAPVARYLERLLPWSADDLLTIGFSALLVRSR